MAILFRPILLYATCLIREARASVESEYSQINEPHIGLLLTNKKPTPSHAVYHTPTSILLPRAARGSDFYLRSGSCHPRVLDVVR